MEPDERMDGRMTGGRGETRDAWKKKDDKGKEYHRRKEEEGRRKPQRTRKTGNVEEKQGYNGNTGTGTMMQETSCTILQKPLRKPPVPAHPPIKETCAFSQYGSILRTKKEPLQQQLSFPSNINFLNYRSSKSSPASYPSVSRSSVPASWSATSGAAASCSSSRSSRRSPDTIS